MVEKSTKNYISALNFNSSTTRCQVIWNGKHNRHCPSIFQILSLDCPFSCSRSKLHQWRAHCPNHSLSIWWRNHLTSIQTVRYGWQSRPWNKRNKSFSENVLNAYFTQCYYIISKLLRIWASMSVRVSVCLSFCKKFFFSSKMDQICKFGEETSRILEFKPEGLDFYVL